MPSTRITAFGGIIPRLAARQLPGESARAATNVSLLSGELQPMRKSEVMWAPAALELRSFYRVDDETWFGWPAAGVQMQPGALEGEARYAYTGDGVPKITTKALGTPVLSTGEPAAARTLGIPAPQAAPTLAAVGGAGPTVTRFYVYTFYSDWNEESAPSPVSPSVNGNSDGTWNVGGMGAAPPNSGNVTAAVHAAGIVTITLDAAHYLREREVIVLASIGGMTDLNGVWSVLGTPAPNQITIELTTAQTYTAGGTWTRENPWGSCTKRLYRTAGNVADFQLVAEGITGATYADTLSDAQIPGDSLVSQGWAPPPVDLVGLVALSNGVLAGFIEGSKTICQSEPYQPHAWPSNYRRNVFDKVVGLAAYDTTLVAATAGPPVVFTGLEPGQMLPTRHPKPFPAVSRASVCSLSDGAVYASKNGLVRVDQAGAALFSDVLFSPEVWNSLNPSTMACAFDGSRLLVSTTVNKQAYLIDLSGVGTQMVSVFQPMDSVRADDLTGEVFFAFGRKVYRFDAFGAAPLTLDWWSKEYVLAKPANLGAARVEVDADYSAQVLGRLQAERAAIEADNATLIAAPQGGRGGYNSRAWAGRAWNGSALAPLPAAEVTVALTVYAKGVLVFSKAVPNEKAFALPGGYKADSFSVRVQTNTQVKAVCVADTAKALSEV